VVHRHAAPVRPAHILVVDDDLLLRETVAAVLRGEGWRVTLAGTGRAALGAVTQQVPDLVLLDLRMPDLDGWQTLRRLRVIAPSLPVVIMTVAERTDTATAAAHGARFLAKPFTLDHLRTAVTSALA